MSVAEFLALHRPGDPLLMPNAWDVGSALILQGLGFRAVATTSSGFAATLGRADGEVSAVRGPVSADLENGFHDEPEQVAEIVASAVESGLAGRLDFLERGALGRATMAEHLEA